MHFDLYRSHGQWRWRLIAGNREVIASGESYHNRTDALGAIRIVRMLSMFARVREKAAKAKPKRKR